MVRPSDPAHLNSVWLIGTVEESEEPPGTVASGLRFGLRGGPSVFVVEAPLHALEGRVEDLGPGTTVRIIGRLRQHRWTNADGVRGSETLIVGELVEPLSREGVG